ncbi:3-oxoacyl-[acyl-carrier protein] reductase [Diaminobutyricimonas aerilata]|uniref:3-oxoacyl-[acyl-carrier protein] reductase n=1 Tax=Diaminobutyricimonas aerilata TaxID=1162967 RepID=A0A2M9CMR1_9MICO|nr:SDR family NAD(P)-dependent oxidoreductase [Diaminobutyricimonas aerilata]PJJ73134.1 3-oxoacyl-[acyl-carrier protein] reductase [Diaminobutyricimonas aerilata]
MQFELADRVVVVTGAGRGIGRVIAETFVEQDARVIVLDLPGDDLDAARGTFEPRGAALACDVRDRASVDAAVAEVVERFGRLDVLVNNAGINVTGTVEELDDEAWARCFDVNVAGVFRACRAVIPQLKRQRAGRIINAASFAAIVPSIGSAAYAASKAAVVQFTRVLAGELGPWGVTVNAYAPGMIPTAMNGFAELPAEAQDRLLDTLSLRRWGDPREVADAVCFLASDAARYVTGTLLDVSGGKLATQIPSAAYERAAAG